MWLITGIHDSMLFRANEMQTYPHDDLPGEVVLLYLVYPTSGHILSLFDLWSILF